MRRKQIALLAAAASFFLLDDFVHAQVYKGVVLDEATREPVPYVTVSLQNEENEHVRHTSTDEEGTFLLVAPDVTMYFLNVKRIGYSENTGGPFLVETGDTLSVQFRILETTETLGELTVEGTPYEETLIENYLKSKNFYTRKNQGIGQFLTKDEIQERQVNFTSDIFRYTHGIRKVNGSILSRREMCSPKIVLNGMTMTSSPPLMLAGGGNNAPLDIDIYTSVDNLIGIEIYAGLPGQPFQFGTRSRCGAIVLWIQ